MNENLITRKWIQALKQGAICNLICPFELKFKRNLDPGVLGKNGGSDSFI